MAAVSRAFSAKSMSRRISSVPVESVTALNTCSTEIMESDMGFSFIRRHCTALAFLAFFAGPWPVLAQTANAATPAKTIVVVGDSLSAEYGLKRGTGWVALLEQRLAKEKMAAKVVNASISGDTTSGGRSRLPALLAQHHPRVVVIELGGNDALRGLPLAMTQDNLQAMARAAQAAGAKVLIVGMQVPPNYGQDYADKFAATFASVATEAKAAYRFYSKALPTAPMRPNFFKPTASTR
jgi:acyl-CoA thioesterase I